LLKRNISPYDGDTFHETPLMLLAADLLSQLPSTLLYIVFILSDVITAVTLAFSVEKAKNFYVSNTATPAIYAFYNYYFLV
jgi:hypothetical protein